MSGVEPLLAGAIVCLVAAAVPLLLFLVNLAAYRAPPPPEPGRTLPAVSVLIPARDEAAQIEGAVRAALASRGVTVEVVVLDDASTDDTAAIVARLAVADARVRLRSAPVLPAGWCGKQHACWSLAHHARHPVLVFVDADVRLAPDAAVRAAAFLEDSGAALVSGFPRQETGTLMEKLLIPLIHFVLLGFLPVPAMRRSLKPGFGAGCGQLMVARADAYRAADGHRAIRASLHDGLELPRAFRRAGLRSDLFDATALAVCRMYHDAGGVWRGLAKNATEGLGAPGTIVVMTLLLGAGQVLPPLVLAARLGGLGGAAALDPVALVAAAGTAAGYLPRLLAAARFRQSWLGALLHPLGVVLLLAIQWWAWARARLGLRERWKGRSYDGAGSVGGSSG